MKVADQWALKKIDNHAEHEKILVVRLARRLHRDLLATENATIFRNQVCV